MNTAQQGYAQLCNGFANDLTFLGLAGAVAGTQPFLSPDMTVSNAIVKSGYNLFLGRWIGCGCGHTGPCVADAPFQLPHQRDPNNPRLDRHARLRERQRQTIDQDVTGVALVEPFVVNGNDLGDSVSA